MIMSTKIRIAIAAILLMTMAAPAVSFARTPHHQSYVNRSDDGFARDSGGAGGGSAVGQFW
jgi:hypothetical protein